MDENHQAEAAAALAYEEVMGRAFNPVFFNKLASAGVTPRDEREAQQLLSLGAALYAEQKRAEAAEYEKQGSLVDYAYRSVFGDGDQANPHALYKAAADQGMTDPALAAALLTLAPLLAGE